MRVLVTGHLGLIGSEVCAQLLDSGIKPRGLDWKATGSERGDITSHASVTAAMSGCSAAVHLASISDTGIVERSKSASRAINVGGTRTVLGAAERLGVPMVYASSREVYGERCCHLPVIEDAELAPVNEYGRQKCECEQMVLSSLLPASVVRFSNVYGSARDYPDRVVPAFVRMALAGGELQVHGLDSAFDFTHVSDAARLVVMLATRLAGGKEIPPVLNCCTGRATSLRELADLCCDIAGAGTVALTQPRSRDPSWFCGSTVRAARFGWRYQIELEDGIRALAEEYKTHGTID